jgi:hypothetical protein
MESPAKCGSAAGYLFFAHKVSFVLLAFVGGVGLFRHFRKSLILLLLPGLSTAAFILVFAGYYEPIYRTIIELPFMLCVHWPLHHSMRSEENCDYRI